MNQVLKFKRADDVAALPMQPHYATAGAGCFDLAALEGAVVMPGASALVRTGLVFEVPEGYILAIFSRSGHGFKYGLRLANCTGIIDSNYRGEVMVKLHNDGAQSYSVTQGERIAQAMLLPAVPAALVEVQELSATARGAAGFGSTGKG